MLLSIIIPVYNVKDYLEACVASVLDTDFKDYEVILVDDGSTDGESPKLCDKIAAKHPELIRVIHQENKGLGGARNTGIARAEGEYLFFIDSDDTVVPNAVGFLAQKILQTKADVISFNIYTDDGCGNRSPVYSNQIQVDEPFSLSEKPEFLLSLPNAWGRVWRKKLFTDNGIVYPNKVWYEDIRTTTKLFACADSIVTIPDLLYVYLQRQGSIMRSANIERNVEIIDAFEDFVSWYKEKGLFEQYKDELCHLAIMNVFVAASVRVLMADTKHPLLKQLREYLETNYPDFKKNKYLSSIPKMKKLAYKLLLGKHYRTLKLLFTIKK